MTMSKPVFKKDDKTDKENYRPISILPTLSKLCERLIYKQMYPYFDKLFSKFQCGFRKGFDAQHSLINMTEKWQRSVDGGGQAPALLTDLSKAFDCIGHELLIAKLYAYGFNKNYLYFINSYLKGRKQRTKKIPFIARLLRSIQYNSSLGITVAIKGGSSRKKRYQ